MARYLSISEVKHRWFGLLRNLVAKREHTIVITQRTGCGQPEPVAVLVEYTRYRELLEDYMGSVVGEPIASPDDLEPSDPHVARQSALSRVLTQFREEEK